MRRLDKEVYWTIRKIPFLLGLHHAHNMGHRGRIRFEHFVGIVHMIIGARRTAQVDGLQPQSTVNHFWHCFRKRDKGNTDNLDFMDAEEMREDCVSDTCLSWLTSNQLSDPPEELQESLSDTIEFRAAAKRIKRETVEVEQTLDTENVVEEIVIEEMNEDGEGEIVIYELEELVEEEVEEVVEEEPKEDRRRRKVPGRRN